VARVERSEPQRTYNLLQPTEGFGRRGDLVPSHPLSTQARIALDVGEYYSIGASGNITGCDADSNTGWVGTGWNRPGLRGVGGPQQPSGTQKLMTPQHFFQGQQTVGSMRHQTLRQQLQP
jgi:hypothetical protein